MDKIRIILAISAFAVLATGLSVCNHLGCGAARVVMKETSPAELQRKYEWFRDTAAHLDAKRSNIESLTGQMDSLDADYKDLSRADWPRDDRTEFRQLSAEHSGLKQSYNGLAADWNAQLSKWNWQLVADRLPSDAAGVLSNEFKTYR